MKKIPLLLFLGLFFSFAVSAQTNQACPTIDVSSEGIAKPGDLLTFTSRVEKVDLSKLGFIWTVSGGELSEGQGTASIKVRVGDTFSNTTATVEITGLPEDCPNAFSETAPPWDPSFAFLVDEFSARPSLIDKKRLENLVTELQNNPGANIFIVEYFKPKTPQRIIDQKIQKLTDYLLFEKQLEKERFTMVSAELEETRTKFWLVPLGTPTPKID